ncbi:hypothetical protein J437_LFUL009383 [Ladona fulva]|uniref:Uncharacterized protein n=1 Tax=Ladona fulva TaxID=123851 RepID=A0A8K0K5L2_LADFU|nr:hypothetical protein J437_LFUL009383 [Ladona fulva]
MAALTFNGETSSVGLQAHAIIQSGYMPTVLQQLCSLPFEYFSSPPLTMVLFPTLLACCRGNRENRHILEREVSYQVS